MKKISAITLILHIGIKVCCAQICGCTDPLATNYNATASVNDGSCIYPSTTIVPTEIGTLDSLLAGSSSLISWNAGLWTFNDHNDCCLYQLDSTDGSIVDTLCINGITNYDIEEISQDSLYLYFGDFGNNAGTRDDLHIYRILKTSLFNTEIEVDTIWFSYEDQTDFSYLPQHTDFDCEAFVVTDDSIYLFTKQWVSEQTTTYAVPKIPGRHTARKCATYNTGGLITGATYIQGQRLVVLCGYDYDAGNMVSALHPFVLLLYDFQHNEFFSGNKRRLDFGTYAKEQIEAVATQNNLDYFVTNEHFTTTQMGITITRPARLQKLDFTAYLADYLSIINPDTSAIASFGTENSIRIYPNPTRNTLYVVHTFPNNSPYYKISDIRGNIVQKGRIKSSQIKVTELVPGTYVLSIKENKSIKSAVFIKK